jgi:hypothetical protein
LTAAVPWVMPQVCPSTPRRAYASATDAFEGEPARKVRCFVAWPLESWKSSKALASPDVEGEAGTPVTVVSLPARGRPPEAAARRAGLEFVGKLLTTAMVALLDGAERKHAAPLSVGRDSACGRVGYEDTEGMSGRVGVNT